MCRKERAVVLEKEGCQFFRNLLSDAIHNKSFGSGLIETGCVTCDS